MVTSVLATVAVLLSWCQCAVATRVAFSNFSVDNSVDSDVRSSFIQRRLRSQERREMQREILSILGLPHRPRPLVHTKHNAAPMFMLDLYNTISTNAAPGYPYYQTVLPTQTSTMVTPQDSRFLDDADTVMSFVNLGKYISNFLNLWINKYDKTIIYLITHVIKCHNLLTLGPKKGLLQGFTVAFLLKMSAQAFSPLYFD